MGGSPDTAALPSSFLLIHSVKFPITPPPNHQTHTQISHGPSQEPWTAEKEVSQDKTQASKNFLHPYPPEGAFWGPPGECGPISTQSALKLTAPAESLAWHSRRPPECAAPGLQPRNTDTERYAFCPQGDFTQILRTRPDVKQLHMNCVVIYCWVHGTRLNCSHCPTQHSFAASTGCSEDSLP